MNSSHAVEGRRTAEDFRDLVDAHQLADRWNCSARHVRRLADRGLMPQPLKLGALTRWSESAIDRWIEQGCPGLAQEVRP